MQQSYREQKFRSFSTYAVCKNVQVSKIFYNDATILSWTKFKTLSTYAVFENVPVRKIFYKDVTILSSRSLSNYKGHF